MINKSLCEAVAQNDKFQSSFSLTRQTVLSIVSVQAVFMKHDENCVPVADEKHKSNEK